MNLHSDLNLKFPKELIEQFKEMVIIKNPCFIHGKTGKSAFIKSIYPDTLFIDSREILEIKSLGGFYAVKNSELIYVEGILTTAMKNGYKICFKNIDMNIHILYYLRPVIDGKNFMASNGSEISAHENFRIFFTCKNLLSFRNVAFIGPIQFNEEQVIESFGNKKQAVKDVLNFIKHNKSNICPKDKGLDCDGICLKDSESCSCDEYLCNKHFRMLIELKDTLNFLSPEINTNSFRIGLNQSIVNIFLRHESRTLIEFLMIPSTPISLPNMLFAKTHAVESALKSLILNIKIRKPSLLVGETGAGKTAIVQYLCSNSEYFFNKRVTLKAVNMSADFDSSDLIGGYQSIDFIKKISELYHRAKIEMPKSIQKRSLLEQLIEKLKRRRDISGCLLEESLLLLKLLDKKVPFFYKEGILADAMRNGHWLLLDEINLASEETLNLLDSVLSKDELILFESGNFSSFKIHENFMIFACMNPYGDFGKKKYETTVFNKILFYDFSYRLSCITAVVQSVTRNLITDDEKIANFYFEFKNSLNRREFINIVEPLISGRTLCRALNLILQFKTDKNIIYKAFNLLFFTQLDFSSRALALKLFKKHFGVVPTIEDFDDCKSLDGFIITPKVKIQMTDVDLAIKANLPVLLQGDTSTGKTSLILALATKYQRKVIRINNHNQTESSDYMGNYLSTKDGIKFSPGPLITAMKKGYWVILDELNLAPSDVLEVLNRLLDDNRELYVPEMDETIRPHPDFRIFATQNLNYGGRHGLAKSFRNRFIEIFFYEKSEADIKEILEKSYSMPPSFTKYMLSIYSTLKTERTLNSFISLRDMFKWARRQPTGYYDLFEIGLDIIIERQRSQEDKNTVISVFKIVFQDRFNYEKKDFIALYSNANQFLPSMTINNIDIGKYLQTNFSSFIFTKSYIRLINLIYKAWLHQEPVLLIGETGIGKTRICEILSLVFGVTLQSINVHSGTESSDFIGHPVLENGEIGWRDGPLVEAMLDGNAFLIDEINLAEDSALERLNSVLEDNRRLFIPETSKEIRAADTFKVIATMNPSGDFGKRELSPALRSRFTEIYFSLDANEYGLIFDRMIDALNLSTEYKDFFKSKFASLGNLSIRKVEMICNHIKNILVNNEKSYSSENYTFYFMDKITAKEDIWNEVLETLGFSIENDYSYSETHELFGVKPYYLQKKNTVAYSFDCKTTRVNLQRIIRGMTLNKGMLLQGEPGVGKTSIVQSIAKAVGIPVLRINLSDQTEMSDLVGSYLPQGESIKFVESEMVHFIRSGYWIILDEINLCTQSVIEGLNSMLDHRRMLKVDGKPVSVHENTKIFGTMNPHNRANGRKIFPKSFMDRFIVISMESYSLEDMKSILSMKFGNSYLFDSKLSIRGNLKYNELEKIGDYTLVNGKMRGNEKIHFLKDNKTTYEFYSNSFGRFGSIEFDTNELPEDFTILTSQIPQIDILLRCILKGIPVILYGSLGRNALLRFVSNLFNLKLRTVDCHKDTDISDLLGQYQKCESTDGSSIFEWVDSPLINALREQSLIVFNTPELIEKSVFDRLNSLFENEKSINIHEKGYETKVISSKNSRLVLCCDNPQLLSPALIDRCISIELSNSVLYIDLFKIFISKFKDNISIKKFKSSFKDNLFTDLIDTNYVVSCDDLDLEIKRTMAYQKLPLFLNKNIDIINTIDEHKILQMFSLPLNSFIEFDQSHLQIYKEISQFSIQLPTCLEHSISSLINKPYISTLIKCLNKVSNLDYFNCKNIPTDIYTLKISFLESLKSRSLEEINQVYLFSKNNHKLSNLKSVTFDLTNFYSILTEEDPLNLIKSEILNEKILKENEIKEKIKGTAIDIYKYGKGDLEVLLKELETTMKNYGEVVAIIDSRLRRNYRKFLDCIKTLTLCDYLNNPEIREFLEDFTDLSDYFLINLFENRDNCHKCHRKCSEEINSTRQCSLRLIRNVFGGNFYEKLLKPEYSKFLFNRIINNPQSLHGLVLEAICFNEIDNNLLTDELFNQISIYKPELLSSPLQFSEQEIDGCIESLFSTKTKAFVIDKRDNQISIGTDLISLFDFSIDQSKDDLSSHPNSLLPLESIRKLSLFSTPEKIINEIQEVRIRNEGSINLPMSDEASIFTKTVKKLDQLETSLKALYKKESCLYYDRNYSYFQYLMFSDLSIGTLENYFMNCLVYEFLDRMYFAESLLNIIDNIHTSSTITDKPSSSNSGTSISSFIIHRFSKSLYSLLYNSTLLSRSFEIDRKFNQKLHETRIKLFKEPNLYEQTISTFVDKFLYIPVLTVFTVNFEIPVNGFECCCKKMEVEISKNSYYDHLFNQILTLLPDDNCACEKFVKLSESFNRNFLLSLINQKINKDDLINSFYSRMPEYPFSFAEICLAKVINNVIFNMNSSKYDQETLNACLNLCLCAIHKPSPAFMYFIYVFSNTFEEQEALEEGVGLKSGTGQNNMEDKDIHESDICDEFDDQKNENIDSEGVDLNNEGDLHSISDQDDAENDVDALDNNEGVEESEDNEERGEIGKEDNTVGEEIENKSEESQENEANQSEISEVEEMAQDEESNSQIEDENTGTEMNSNEISEDNDSAEECQQENDLFTYEWKESSLNQNQTCSVSDGYNRKVEGGNLEQKDALKEGEGEEFVEGEGEIGKEGNLISHSVKFNKINLDCTKLSNLLRITLESNKTSKYKGDFKSGKKLNLKKIVAYIASDFRKDKIWMKRTKNDKKEYIFRIFIDNSKSMFDQSLVDALSTIYYKLESSLSLLNIPVQLYKFGNTLKECTVEDLTFDEDRTVIDWTDQFTDGINLILTDGIFQSVGYSKDNFLVIMIDKGNIKSMSKVNMIENRVFIEKYLDSFTLKYCIVQQIEDLEKTFIEALTSLIKDIQL